MNSLDFSTCSKLAVIFGGEGFIGKHLRIHLESFGYKVLSVDLNEGHTSANSGFVSFDLRNPINLDLPVRPELVFNLAAIHKNPGHRKTEYYETNILSAINVLNWCEIVEVKNITFVSSAAVYGNSEDVCNEKSKLFPTSDYGKSKVISEELHQAWSANHPNIKLNICRPAVIFGAGEKGNFSRLIKNVSRKSFIIPFDENVSKPSGYVKDLARALLFMALNKEGSEVFNFAFPHAYTLREVCDTISEIGGYSRVPNLKIGRTVMALDKIGVAKLPGLERIKKLQRSLNMPPVTLLENEFQWEFDLRTALIDWRSSTNWDLD